jgi:CRISPR-associated protein Cmr6
MGKHYRILFGETDESGCLAFHDAWILPECLNGKALLRDVMTPHHGAYNAGPDKQKKVVPPTDFDDPNPIAYLSVSGTFLLAVSCEASGESGRSWAELGMNLLGCALTDWGIGGKTSSGYGRMSLSEIPASGESVAASEPQ